MSVPHPLNQAVIAQALHDQRNGQLRRCQLMGFDARSMEALKHPDMVSMLANAPVPWCRVIINRDVLHRILDQMPNVKREREAIDRMLRLGASSEMISEFHGLSHQEVALRREVLSLPPRKGRWPMLTEAQDTALWEEWRSGVKRHGIDHSDDAGMLDLAMDLAEHHSLPLAVVWAAIRDWIDQGLT